MVHIGLKIAKRSTYRVQNVVHIGLKNAKEHYFWAIFGHICLKLGQSEFSRKIETSSLNE